MLELCMPLIILQTVLLITQIFNFKIAVKKTSQLIKTQMTSLLSVYE